MLSGERRLGKERQRAVGRSAEHFYVERRKSHGVELLKHRGKVKGTEAVLGEVSQDLK